ncbi:MAG: dTMP kinase [Parcubacteria group bacterium]|nr:dTMP kinase [Parcubacteria group bacterium]|tara:strand:- start:17292 stop:17939 length:648 start_codon:yes stop_codon:yes gene_type:complete
MSGKLIVIDGIDGSGKATQTDILVKKLKQKGQAVETVDFPQYTQNFFGGMVRKYLDGQFGIPTEVDPYLASILYAGDRFESSQKIKDWLAADKLVVLDRYYTSNFIHQTTKMAEGEIDDFISWEHKLEFEIFKIPEPDLVIYLHVEPKIAYQLVSKRGSGHDGHDTLDHMRKAEQRSTLLADKLNWTTVKCSDGKKPLAIEKISQKIFKEVKKII